MAMPGRDYEGAHAGLDNPHKLPVILPVGIGERMRG